MQDALPFAQRGEADILASSDKLWTMCPFSASFFLGLVWWLNGGEPANVFSEANAPAADLNALTQWNDLPLKQGDVVAHRFRDEWEECYSGAELSVNGNFEETT